MTTFATSETRLRRFLRDPNALIWSSDDLMTFFNDAQIEIAMKTGELVRVENHYYPTKFDYAYLQDWEKDSIDGTGYQAFKMNQASGDVICYPWENNYYLSITQTIDDGSRYTQPWEAHFITPADPPAVALHAKFDTMLLIAYDRDKLEPIDKKGLETQDPFYKARTGAVTNYWREDDYSNLIYPYPRPSTIVWQIPDETVIYDDTGGMHSSAEEGLDEIDYGIMTDYIETEDAFFMVYTAQPTEITERADESDFPAYMMKYIEYGALERAFGADTDGYIPSLRDYWKLRKEVGFKAIQRFKRMTLTDRDYRLGGQPRPTSSHRLRLPDGYPAV